jgi:hypothetical protein
LATGTWGWSQYAVSQRPDWSKLETLDKAFFLAFSGIFGEKMGLSFHECRDSEKGAVWSPAEDFSSLRESAYFQKSGEGWNSTELL